MKRLSLSVIIPVFNEMRTIGSILEIVRTWGRAEEIIVVDDGSTDKTTAVVREFSESVRLFTMKKQSGKSEAMRKGIIAARGEYVMFLDGDLLGLTHKALDELYNAVLIKKADMVVGVRGTGHPLSAQFPAFGGERVIRRQDMLGLLKEMKHTGYGVEVVLNKAFEKKHIEFVKLHYVSHQIKLEKHPLHLAISSYIREAFEVLPRHLWFSVIALVRNRRKI